MDRKMHDSCKFYVEMDMRYEDMMTRKGLLAPGPLAFGLAKDVLLNCVAVYIFADLASGALDERENDTRTNAGL